MPEHTPVYATARSALKIGFAVWAVLCANAWAAPGKPVQNVTTAAPSRPATDKVIHNSNMDAPLFYQVLIAEIQANAGDPGTAYQLFLDAARRHKSEQLFQRAVEVALRARAGEQALTAAKAWGQAHPQSRPAAEFTSQIMLALGRTSELAETLRKLVEVTPAPQQPQLLLTLPRSLQRLNDKKLNAQIIEEITQPWRSAPKELAEAWAISSEAWLRADHPDKAQAALDRAAALSPDLPAIGLIAVELMKQSGASEKIVIAQMNQPQASSAVRLAYARQLTILQRYQDAENQLALLVRDQPDQMGHWLLLAAVRLEQKNPDEAEAALQTILSSAELRDAPRSESTGTQNAPLSIKPDLEQAYLLMAQAADLRGKTGEALDWISRADPRREKLIPQSQRARLLVKQGRLQEARTAIRAIPEGEPRDAVLKYQAESQILRDTRNWKAAYEVLNEATQRFPDDSDLLYDQAMMAERLQRWDEMEALLKRVIALSPENPNAYNALGYSLADRAIRLEEARPLIERALSLRPGDPFITDSLGWLEYRLGNIETATRLLTQAWMARQDAEIAAHLGEVLWQQGQTDRAIEIWRHGLKIESGNETMQQVLKRLKVKL